MIYRKLIDRIPIPQYEYVSNNQYGMRFKRIEDLYVPVLELALQEKDSRSHEYNQLILLGENLEQLVHFEMEDSQATVSIQVVSAQRLREALK